MGTKQHEQTVNEQVDTSNGETIWHVEFASGDEQYVLAPDERSLHTVLQRMYSRPRYDFDWEDYECMDTGSTDVVSAARGNTSPFSVLEAKRYNIIEHEKRVNQAGYNGMSRRVWHR